jgi:hypothetical protein
LARGITWAPAYLVDLSDPRIASVSARAIVVNELMDLERVRRELISGFPNVKFGEVSSPIAMNHDLATFLTALANGRDPFARTSSSMLTQQMVLGRSMRTIATEEPGQTAMRRRPKWSGTPVA